jgi:hypothetical protein
MIYDINTIISRSGDGGGDGILVFGIHNFFHFFDAVGRGT